MTPLPCFVCGRELEPIFRDDPFEFGQPSGAVMFMASGNYGSTVFDPTTGYQRLYVNLCDTCLRTFAERVRHVIYEPQVAKITDLGPWDPSAPD